MVKSSFVIPVFQGCVIKRFLFLIVTPLKNGVRKKPNEKKTIWIPDQVREDNKNTL